MNISAIYHHGCLLVDQVEVPRTSFQRAKGLLGYREIQDKFAMVFKNTKQIHTFFMKTTIDVLYLDSNFNVLYVKTIKPWRLGPYLWNATCIVEAKEGAFSHIQKGDQINFY